MLLDFETMIIEVRIVNSIIKSIININSRATQ